MTDTLQPAAAGMLAEIRDGLGRPQKELPPKYFYDERGSELFEEITRLPEYYLTRTEAALLRQWMPDWIWALQPKTLVELGAGSAEKTRIVLDAIRDAVGFAAYVPVDVSADFLESTAVRLSALYPTIDVVPVVADMTADFALPPELPHPVLHAFLGSTIGNFAPDEATALLARVRRRMHTGDAFLMGVDLRKDPRVIEAAYNDAAGVTAEFNRNMLRVVNTLAGADFDPAAYDHRAFYNPVDHRIEMHLVARAPQTVAVPGAGEFAIAAGETIRTEISCKHDRASIEAMLRGAGMRLVRWETDEDGLYAILLAAVE
ncbi:L-histidine N(alpha)-methyltransferase [Longimicrobium sp.]|uniref:L-histidine N(alpha)-methyltransferase n=1 Tax=Longimicrobium sp. TaxID=2029185 RepID=UPI002D01058F|nr:L-histidine N(alpha)-methyltransferase [Longimicrobium sp.]HSU16846.1 L-histidine N(alpha)-methyltransferase [Longimicrobium sp.]